MEEDQYSKIISDNFSELMNNMNPQIQESQ